MIQTNNLEVVHSLQMRTSNSSVSALVKRIHQLLKNNENWLVTRVPTEVNQVAVQNDSEGINVLAEAPSNLIEDIANDKSKGLFELISVV